MMREMLPHANDVTRAPVPASHLVVGLQCGGSDGYSGITANPALGAAVDLLVRHGGTAILSETPEIYGAEHLLTRRAVSRAVGEKLVARIRWWEEYTAREKGEMNNNPSPGNKAGGLTTILEKSLGAVAKGGTTNLVDVYEYARAGHGEGLRLHGHAGLRPGVGDRAGRRRREHDRVHDRAAARRTAARRRRRSSCRPTRALWAKQEEDIDLNCGEIADGRATIDGHRRAAVRADARHRVGREVEERAARLRAERVRALVAGRGDVRPPRRHPADASSHRGCARRWRRQRRRARAIRRTRRMEAVTIAVLALVAAAFVMSTPAMAQEKLNVWWTKASTKPRTTHCSRRSGNSRARPASRSSCRSTRRGT